MFLSDLHNGQYSSRSGLGLLPAQQYHLKIIIDNRAYLSGFESVKTPPAIDSIGCVMQTKGIQLFLNTHDPANET